MMLTVVPWPRRERMLILPWCMATTRATMAKPRPVPLAFVVVKTAAPSGT